MLPSFLRPEVVPYTAVTVVHADGTESELIARKTDTAPAAPRPVVCAWCPDFDATTQPAGVSHGICGPCSVRFEQEGR